VNIKIFNKDFRGLYSFTITNFLLTILLINLPLFDSFGYEFSFVFALFFFVFGGLLNIQRKSKLIADRTYFIFVIINLVIPLLIIFFLSLFRPICSFWFGTAFYITIPVISFILSYFLSEIVQFLFPRFRKTFFLIIVLLIGLIPVIEIYFNPQIYFFSPIIGFFPGTIYDENLSVDLTLVLYRIINIIFFGASFLAIRFKLIKNKIIFLIFVIAFPVIFYLLSPQLGFSTTHSRLENVFHSTYESKNFVIKYQEAKTDTNKINALVLSHEFYFAQLKEILGFSPDKKITSYIFKNRNQKKRYFGSELADVAKPWLYEIYLSEDSWENSLKHEIIHIFSAEIGSGIFKLAGAFNPALIEGFPEAIDNNFDDIDLYTVAVSAFNYGYKLNIEDLFSGLNFFKSFSGLSYLYAGSFTKYLIDKYGLKNFAIFYKSNNSEDAFGKNLSELSNEYYEFLKEQKIRLTEEKIEYYFGRTSIFKKLCPRQIASQLRQAESFIAEKNNSEAEKILSGILEIAPNYSAVSWLTQIYYEKKDYRKAIDLLKKYLKHFKNTPYFYNLKLSSGDFYFLLDDTLNSMKQYDELIELNPHINLKALASLRIELYRKGDLKNYLSGDDSVKFQILTKINQTKPVLYSLIPLINLAERLKVDYRILPDIFRMPLTPSDDEEAYLVFQFSKYLLGKFDIINARKLAALALRKSFNSIYYISIKEHFDKCNWFVKNYQIFSNR